MHLPEDAALRASVSAANEAAEKQANKTTISRTPDEIDARLELYRTKGTPVIGTEVTRGN